MKCADCFYGEQAQLDATNIGQVRPVICRRLPPAAQLLPTNQGVQMVANFPLMAPENWCWEFKEKAPTDVSFKSDVKFPFPRD